MKKLITYSDAINEALHTCMQLDKKIICMGLGINDPKNIFGTTKNLEKKFGKNRVFDMPTSENAMTGIAIGASLDKFKVVITHQRLDFILLAMDQIINGAAKWHYMFGGSNNISITIRLIVGRGWGQGPTHSQSLQSLFAHIPGLKVVMPSSAYDAKGLLISSIFDKNPVIFIEHRWLHSMQGYVPKKKYDIKLGKPKKILIGDHITIVAMSYMTIEAINSAKFLKKYGINCEIIDLRTVSPIDYSIIYRSIKKTKRLMVLDTSNKSYSIASEIVATCSENVFNYFLSPPKIIALPDIPVPTSYSMTKDLYPDSQKIIKEILKIMNIKIKESYKNNKNHKHDIPHEKFKGPF
jgi:acetoin:2,6-dichlorophenolindophenol oxidoreductase subunit beta